ncbi:MAG: hypothetical protein AB8F74_00655, partial [Saprospiraceae bacterium]
MKKRIHLLSMWLIVSTLCNAQKEGHIWMLANTANGIPLEEQSPIMFNFNEAPFTINQVLNDFNFYITNTSISNQEGELVCYSNGVEIRNNEHEVLINGSDFQSPTANVLGYP